MFGTPTMALVRLAIRLGAAAIGILLLFAGLVRTAQPDRHDVLTNTSKPLKDERPLKRATQTYLCLTRSELRVGSKKTGDAGHGKGRSPVACACRVDRTSTSVWSAG